jgi:hypothetical protein
VLWCSGLLLPWCPADLLLRSAPLLLCSSAACMDSFLLCLSAACQQRKHLMSRFFDPLSSPPLPSLLSFTRQFHFYAAFSLVRPCRPTAAKLALILASSMGHGLLQRRCPLPAGSSLPSSLPGRLFQGPVTICDAPPYWLRPRPVAWIARSPAWIRVPVYPGPNLAPTLQQRRI